MTTTKHSKPGGGFTYKLVSASKEGYAYATRIYGFIGKKRVTLTRDHEPEFGARVAAHHLYASLGFIFPQETDIPPEWVDAHKVLALRQLDAGTQGLTAPSDPEPRAGKKSP